MSDLYNAMSFETAFDQFIKGRKVVDFGFRKPDPVKLSNGFFAYPCGYYTLYDNGCKLIVYGFSFGQSTMQEVWVLDGNDVPIGYKDQTELENS
ncbi:MAG: hypothetical protein EOP00_25975 [Pedobacter sp.]|nr:MAG: hypothetical protein EOP00_25975 [Pedobacter sp.]